MPIRQLSPQVVARIAAGEVVERPVSVAKELIENALDAGASAIEVEVEEGGVGLLRVADDGAGIPAAELEMAVQRHATSKIESDADLERIATLGFRGEALASIASVADLTLVSRTADALGASYVRVVNGAITDRGQRGAPPGTSVTVRRLFRDVPARLKFLKSNAAEATRITTLVSHLALAYPEVRFVLTVDGRGLFSSTGAGDLRDALSQLYGLETAQAMLPVRHAERMAGRDVAVAGMTSPAGVTRGNRSYVTIFVNRRLVENRTLTFAVLDAYQGRLMSGRYPIAVLDLTIDPAETDVNVHPAKAQVKFRDEGMAFSAIHHAVRHALDAAEVARPASASPAATGSAGAPAPAVAPRAAAPAQPGAAPAMVRPTAASLERVDTLVSAQDAAATQQGELRLPALRVLGQVRGTFIVCEGPQGVYFIDQHTAHERVLFDQLRREKARGEARSQGLLEPAPAELTPRQTELVEAHGELLRSWGFLLEPFGERTVLIRATPASLTRLAPAKALGDTLDYLDSDELKGYDWEDRVLASIACHGAVRAGQTLTMREMSEMVRLLETADNPHACPHGRPVMVHMSDMQLEKEFSRR
ncbi:MAG: DNA mismatch repair endonuclease MutL [Dehalococcoidia bacterium]|nr:DNA mismatch repair endonuclease MutL [Dehalococcoidia bacterium]